jgi:hypothetical protein
VTLVVIPNLTRNGASYALIENVVTACRHRKRGYAAAFIAHAVEDGLGCRLLQGDAADRIEDPATLRFYENCGFTQNKTGFQIRRPSEPIPPARSVNISGKPASLPKSVASLALVSAISLAQTTTTALPSLCAVSITRYPVSSLIRNTAFSTAITNSRGVNRH